MQSRSAGGLHTTPTHTIRKAVAGPHRPCFRQGCLCNPALTRLESGLAEFLYRHETGVEYPGDCATGFVQSGTAACFFMHVCESFLPITGIHDELRQR